MNRHDIALEYKRLGYDQGWAFAMTPLSRLKTAETMIIGLNPGGEGDPKDAHYESENDNGYYTGVWTEDGSPTAVQAQVRAWHDILGLTADETFAAQFIPFRSKSFASLSRKAEALKFAEKLWTQLLGQARARRVICMGNDVFWQITRLFSARLLDPIESGWGSATIKRALSSDNRLMVGVPHPSRFRLVDGDDGSAKERRLAALRQAFAFPF